MRIKKEGKLTQEYLKSILEYNPETGVFTWLKSNGNKVKNGDIAGSLNLNGYRQIMINTYLYLAHRLAWLYITGEFPSGKQNFIDHIDGDPSNNRFVNLRPCSQMENTRNRGKQLNNTSGFKGVFKQNGRFYARIKNPLTGKRESLGGYSTLEEASIAYERKSLEYSGIFYPHKSNTNKGEQL